MNKACKVLANKLGMKNTRTTALKSSEDFVLITEDGTKFYGGDQNWYYWEEDKNKSAVAVYSGCASVAVANVFSYMSENNDKYKFAANKEKRTKTVYLKFMKLIYDFIKPLQIFGISLGVGSIFLMKRRLKKCANEYNIKFDMINAKKFSKFNYLIDFITTALEKDVPIMMLIGFNGKNMEVYYDNGNVTKGEFMYHWVTVTELIVDKDIEEAVLRCSTWGRSAYISLRDFMKFEPVCRGLLYII